MDLGTHLDAGRCELRVAIANRDLYVMIMSSSDRPEDMDLSREAGADAYVFKNAPGGEIIRHMAAARHIAQQRSSAREIERV